MGSMYDVTPTGTTIRNKARRKAHGDDFGMKPESAETFYVDTDNMNRLGVIQTSGPRKRIVQTNYDQYGVEYLDGPNAGRIDPNSLADVIREPRVGYMPVELSVSPSRHKGPVLPNQGSSGVHFGNKIIDIFD